MQGLAPPVRVAVGGLFSSSSWSCSSTSLPSLTVGIHLMVFFLRAEGALIRLTACWAATIVSSFQGWALAAIALAEERPFRKRLIHSTSKKRVEIRVNSIQISIQESFGRISDGAVVTTNRKRQRFHHCMICLLQLPLCLIIHNMNQTSWYVLEETEAFSVIKVRNLGDETGDAFDGIFLHVLFGEKLLDPDLEAFIGEVDAKLI